MKDMVRDYIRQTLLLIVDKPMELDVTVVTSTKNVIAHIQASQGDMGKVIGKKGRMINALRVIVQAVKSTNFPEDSRGMMVEVIEEEQS